MRNAHRTADIPFLNWRYILFKWNDSDEEMNEARRLAKEQQIGVDRLCWEVSTGSSASAYVLAPLSTRHG